MGEPVWPVLGGFAALVLLTLVVWAGLVAARTIARRRRERRRWLRLWAALDDQQREWDRYWATLAALADAADTEVDR